MSSYLAISIIYPGTSNMSITQGQVATLNRRLKHITRMFTDQHQWLPPSLLQHNTCQHNKYHSFSENIQFTNIFVIASSLINCVGSTTNTGLIQLVQPSFYTGSDCTVIQMHKTNWYQLSCELCPASFVVASISVPSLNFAGSKSFSRSTI